MLPAVLACTAAPAAACVLATAFRPSAPAVLMPAHPAHPAQESFWLSKALLPLCVHIPTVRCCGLPNAPSRPAQLARGSLRRLAGDNGYLCHTRGILLQQEGRAADAREWFVKGTRSKGR